MPTQQQQLVWHPSGKREQLVALPRATRMWTTSEPCSAGEGEESAAIIMVWWYACAPRFLSI